MTKKKGARVKSEIMTKTKEARAKTKSAIMTRVRKRDLGKIRHVSKAPL